MKAPGLGMKRLKFHTLIVPLATPKVWLLVAFQIMCLCLVLIRVNMKHHDSFWWSWFGCRFLLPLKNVSCLNHKPWGCYPCYHKIWLVDAVLNSSSTRWCHGLNLCLSNADGPNSEIICWLFLFRSFFPLWLVFFQWLHKVSLIPHSFTGNLWF